MLALHEQERVLILVAIIDIQFTKVLINTSHLSHAQSPLCYLFVGRDLLSKHY